MKTRFWLLLGALVTAFGLGGCGALGKLAEVSMDMTAKLTGADDPNNKSLLATAGRMQNVGTGAALEAVGMAPASPEAKASAPESVRAVSMADAPATPAPVKKVTKPATSPEKKAVAPGAVKPVVAKKSDIKGKD